MTKPYKVRISIEEIWDVEIHAIDKTEAEEIAYQMEPDEIRKGDFVETSEIVVVDTEEIKGE